MTSEETEVDRLPVVYVRGFAGERGIEKAIDDPFYGFNLGSTHVRVGGAGTPRFHQFESPLLRLMIDEGYELLVRGDQRRFLTEETTGSVEPASLWVHRFYDVSAASLTQQPESFRIEDAAEDLRRLIELIKDRTGASRVLLVAHSMGGLICRCLIQKILPDRGEDATDHVARLFTYGTPHGGIHFEVGFGLLERFRDTFNIEGGAIFGRERMYEYLTPEDQRQDGPPRDWQANRIPPEVFPPGRVFCLIGTNPADYEAALGLSAKAVGPQSDGLVQIDSAQVSGAHRAFVHRSHSGRYGMVNSEEGYQNLRRFLFGDLRISAELTGLELPAEQDLVWQAETKLSVRGLPVVMHERLAAHWCPIQLGTAGADRRSTGLGTTFLSSRAGRPHDTDLMRYTVELGVLSLRDQGGFFGFRSHLEQTSDFTDTLVVDIEPSEAGGFPRAWARWNSSIGQPLRDYTPDDEHLLADEDPGAGEWSNTVPLPEAARRFLGRDAALRLSAQARPVS